MASRSEIKKEITMLEKEIRFIEEKRARSIAALLDCVLNATEPSDADVSFFRTYTAEIDIKRERLQTLKGQIKRR